MSVSLVQYPLEPRPSGLPPSDNAASSPSAVSHFSAPLSAHLGFILHKGCLAATATYSQATTRSVAHARNMVLSARHSIAFPSQLLSGGTDSLLTIASPIVSTHLGSPLATETHRRVLRWPTTGHYHRCPMVRWGHPSCLARCMGSHVNTNYLELPPGCPCGVWPLRISIQIHTLVFVLPSSFLRLGIVLFPLGCLYRFFAFGFDSSASQSVLLARPYWYYRNHNEGCWRMAPSRRRWPRRRRQWSG